jgi:hypothetical protein
MMFEKERRPGDVRLFVLIDVMDEAIDQEEASEGPGQRVSKR